MEGVRFGISGPMTCASSEAEERTYKLLVGKSGDRWLIAIQPNPADNVYVEGGPNSDGFAGRTIEFLIEDGTRIKLRGPWKSNSDDLFKDTGYDIRNKHLTIGICALECEFDYRKGNLYKGVLHKDSDWVIGEYERINKIAQALADKHGKPIYRAYRSQGGGYSGMCTPQGSE